MPWPFVMAAASGLARSGALGGLTRMITGVGGRAGGKRRRRRRLITASELRDLAAIKQVVGKTAAANALVGRLR